MSHGTGYGDKSYWDKRYEEQKDKYDWYLGYDQIKEQLLPYLNVVGGGTAPDGEELKRAAIATSTATPEATSTTATTTTATTTTTAAPTTADTSATAATAATAAPAAAAAAAPATTTTTATGAGAGAGATATTPAGPAAPRARDQLKLLVVGCGNSELSENLYDDGFTDNLSIDYSEVVIERMAAQMRTAGKALKFEAMDVRDLKFKDETFDFLVDKGTLDAILCGSDSAKNAGQMLAECQRVLKKGGFFFIITYGQPQSRLNYLEKSRYKWRVSYQNLGKTRYMYVMENVDPVRTGATPYDD